MLFKNWLLSEEYQGVKAEIPMPDEVHILSSLFKNSGAKIYAVGGAIRDYLYHIFHQKHIPYNPKDVDLTTDQTPTQVIKILSSPEAVKNGIKVFPKGESFGVISAIINGKEFEIATFRTEFYDALTGDGRRPDIVKFSTAKEDAKRRDLNINALFYDMQDKEIRDYNLDDSGQGKGLQDIKNKHVRTVGDPFERFREDKLRILRIVRFFCRFNNDIITKHLDAKTLSAIETFKDLKGVSPERIANEFLSGLSKCLSIKNYLLSFQALDLLKTIFPDLTPNLSNLDAYDKSNDPTAVLSYLFRDTDPKTLRDKLNKLTYSNAIADNTTFILNVAYYLNNKNIIRMLRIRDNLSDVHKKSLLNFGKISGKFDEVNRFLQHKITTNSDDYMHLKGKEISVKMGEDEYENYIKQTEMI